MKQSINEILKTIDDAINSFQDKIPGLQKLLFNELQPLLKEIEIKNGQLLNNVKNLKLLGQLKNKLQKIIINRDYKEAVSKFLDSYNTVAALNIDYFKQFNQKFTPAKTLPLIKELAIETTVNDLVGQGLKVNIVDAVTNILNTNITSGGSYASLQEQLRNHILNNESGDGSLVKYTKQITTDAINQYHATYHETIAQDLSYNWGRYVGSLLTTSREFCILLTAKEWVHKSQLPEIVKGHIDGEQCKLSKSTGLPVGMIPGTDANNFVIRRGGYQCGHSYFMVPDSAVPESIKSIFNLTPQIKEVMNKAKDSGPELDKLGNSVADEYNGRVTPINFKSQKSIARKVVDELGGDIEKLKDSVRNTVVVDYNKLNKVASDLSKDSRFSRVKVQDGPEFYGYKGVITNIKTKNGIVAEMQVNSPGMIYAKELKADALRYMSEKQYNDIAARTGLEGGKGHYYYENIRKINPAKAPKEDLINRDKLIEDSKKYYSNFYGF